MKLNTRDIDGFIKRPPGHYNAALIYGPDHGLAGARAAQLARAVAPDLNDPFNVTILDGEQLAAAALADATQMLSLSAARRLIWLRGATDSAVKAVENVLGTDAHNFFLVIEAGDLGPRSSLRKYCEAQQMCAVIACYVEEVTQLAQVAQRQLAAAGWQLTREDAQYLAQHITGDYALARGEIDKLITYLGQPMANATVSRDMVAAIINDGGAAALDDLAAACFTRQPARLLQLLEQVISDGAATVLIMRSLMRHAARLYQVQSLIAAGAAREDAVGKLAPPLFFKRKDGFVAQLSKWPLASLERALMLLAQLESQLKNAAYDDETVLRQTLLQLASSPVAGTPVAGGNRG